MLEHHRLVFKDLLDFFGVLRLTGTIIAMKLKSWAIDLA
jgi:hypothetical protein